MSNCDPQTLMDDAGCFACLGVKERQALKLQLLCEIKNSIAGLAPPPAAVPTVAVVAYGATVNPDFDGADYQVIALTGDIDLAASANRPAVGFGKSIAIVMTADGVDRALTYNANWIVIGTAPTQVTANKTGVVSLTAIGPNETDVLITYQEEP